MLTHSKCLEQYLAPRKLLRVSAVTQESPGPSIEPNVGKPMKQNQHGGITIQSSEPRGGEPNKCWGSGQARG